MNLRDELLAIRAEHGVLTPAVVLEAARPKDHPLHSRVFDKPVKEAAEAYYLERAHELIRVARIRFPAVDTSDNRTLRAFQAVRGDDETGYVYEPTEEVATDPFVRQLVLREMEREWRQLKARYEHFTEFIAMVAADLADTG